MNRPIVLLTAFGCGLLFAFGLGFGGMTQPSKVIGFLDLWGEWNPSLLFVMGGALITHTIAYRLIVRRVRNQKTPVLTSDFQIPASDRISVRLILGALLFGVGWGLAGYCPAPVLVALASLKLEPFLFVCAMMIGMLSANRVAKNTSS